jgi:hypothetical protein
MRNDGNDAIATSTVHLQGKNALANAGEREMSTCHRHTVINSVYRSILIKVRFDRQP